MGNGRMFQNAFMKNSAIAPFCGVIDDDRGSQMDVRSSFRYSSFIGSGGW
jgi:hypothetical protein